MALPKVVYICEEDDGERGKFLVTYKKLSDSPRGRVGVYRLEETFSSEISATSQKF